MSYDSIKLEKLEKLASEQEIEQLTMKDIVEKNYPTFKESYSIRSCIEILRVHKVSGAAVVNNQNTLLGFVSEFDLLIQASTSSSDERIQYKKQTYKLTESNTIKDALKLLIGKKLKIVPIVDNHNKVVGTLTRITLLNTLIQY